MFPNHFFKYLKKETATNKFFRTALEVWKIQILLMTKASGDEFEAVPLIYVIWNNRVVSWEVEKETTPILGSRMHW
jgi:hypothetical protein